MALVLLHLALLGASPAAVAGLGDADQAVDFRCDTMQLRQTPRSAVCMGNVVVRRGPLLVCCERFEGYADARGGWQRFVCADNVRAQRGQERMWAERATFITALGDLILEGSPLLAKESSLLRGERIVVDTRRENAQVESPQGRFLRLGGSQFAPVPLPAEGMLPGTCPLGPAPKTNAGGKP